MAKDISIKKLFDLGAHLGHQVRRWNPKIAPYLYGARDGVHIFDLEKTAEALKQALDVLKDAASEGKVILLVGTKKQASSYVEKYAKELNIPYVSSRWLGGTLTNFGQIEKSMKQMSEMKEEVGEGTGLTKWEKLQLDKKIERKERFLGGISSLTGPPDMMIVVDTKKEVGAVREAKALGIPVVGIVDSNSDPTQVDWPIPMNDDAKRSLEYVLGLMRDAIKKGQKNQKEVKDEGSE